MNKRDYLIVCFLGMYIILQPLAPSSKIEWLLIGLTLMAAMVYFYELISMEEVRLKFQGDFKAILLDKFTILFVLFFLIMFTTITYSQYKIATLKETLRYGYYVFLYFLIRFRIQKEQLFKNIIKIYIFSLFIVTFIGICDFVRNYIGDMSLDTILSDLRVESTLGHPNAYGAYIIIAFFPVLIMALKSKGKKKVILLLLVLMLSINLALTFSRNAWISLVLGILMMIIIYSWKFLFLLIAPIIVVASSSNILLRIKQLANAGVNEGRIRLWTVASKIIKDNFPFGIGSGNFIYSYKEYVKMYPDLQIVEAETLSPHNTFIKILVETGIFGFGILIALCIVIIRSLYKIRHIGKGTVKSFYSGYLISVGCFFIMNFFEDLFFTPKVTIIFIMFTSMAMSVGYLHKKMETID